MFQQKLAVVKSLSLEEEKIVGSDWADLFRVDIKESGMASALASLDSASSGFIRLASASNAVQVQHPNVNWSTVMQEVPKLVSQEFDHVFKRWSSCLIKAEARLEGQRPRGWVENGVTTFNEEFIESTLLQSKLLSEVGTLYVSVGLFCESVNEFTKIATKFDEKHPDVVKGGLEGSELTRSMVAMILVYHQLLSKFPKLSGKEPRRQAMRDLSKKLKAKKAKAAHSLIIIVITHNIIMMHHYSSSLLLV